jgi:hypothetical protein
LAYTIRTQISRQPVRQHMMLLGTILGDNGFQGLAKHFLVAVASCPYQADKQIRLSQRDLPI